MKKVSTGAYIKAKLARTFIEDIQRSTVKKILCDQMNKGIKAQTIQVQAVIRHTSPSVLPSMTTLFL